MPHIRTSLSAFTLPCAHFTWCPPTLVLKNSSISVHLLYETWFIHLHHIPPSFLPFLGWKILVYLTGSSMEAGFSLWLSFLPFSVYFSFCYVLFETGGGFKQCQHDVSLLCSPFLCWHSACCLSTCTSEHWDGVYGAVYSDLGISFPRSRTEFGAHHRRQSKDCFLYAGFHICLC